MEQLIIIKIEIWSSVVFKTLNNTDNINLIDW